MLARRAASFLLILSCQALETKSGMRPQPEPTGHFLTNSELETIDSIPCLQAKQMQPGVVCNDLGVTASTSVGFVGDVTLSNYPSWSDPVCNSNGEYFCDPMNILTDDERREIALTLKQLRYDSHVTCGAIPSDPDNEYNLRPFRTTDYHYQPFYLGVAMANGWAPGDIDDDSLKVFGQALAAQWNLDEKFIGSPRPYAMCPNVAMLIVVPDRRQVYLSTQSCEFICQDRGGVTVTQVALNQLDSQGAAAGVKAGIEKVYSLLLQNSPLHGPLNVVTGTDSTSDSNTDVSASGGSIKAGSMSNNGAVITQRVIYVLSICAVAVSAFIALGVMLLAPGLMKALDKR